MQSHVAFGHVGNAAAVFVLQRLGVAVVAVHTCQLSNHTGYPDFAGRIFAAEDVRAVIAGAERRGVLDRLDGVLSGWLGHPAMGLVMAETVMRARQSGHKASGQAVYLCDPVMGDDGADGRGRLYAAPDIPAFMRERLLPLADIITPNRFELQILSGMAVSSLAEASRAAHHLLQAEGLSGVVVTSVPFPDPQCTGCLVVCRDGERVIETRRLVLSHPINGGGDVLAALLMAHVVKGRCLIESAERAVRGLFAVLEATQHNGERELALIAAQAKLDGSLT